MTASERILHNVSRYITLLPDEQTRFLALLESRTVKKRQYLLQEGQVCKYSVFVHSGCLKGYTVDKNGFEHLLSFAPPGWWIADMYSLFSQRPGQLYIQATSTTEVWLLSKEVQEQLYREIPKFERFFRILAENSLVSYQQRVIDNLSLSAEERYLRFCNRYPALVHDLPQKEIASYIGVTPEFFSKLRKKMMKKV